MLPLKQLTCLKEASYHEMESPVGQLIIITSVAGLHAILWDKDCESAEYQMIITRFTRSENEKNDSRNKKTQLMEYFAGKRKSFDLPLVLEGTAFQKSAWY